MYLLLLLVCTIYAFTTSLYLCVVYHYVFIDLYIESRGLATIFGANVTCFTMYLL